MVNAKKCDRCGSYYEPLTTDNIGKTTSQRLQWANMVELSICFDDYNTRILQIDMCPECMRKQIQFLQKSPLTRRIKEWETSKAGTE